MSFASFYIYFLEIQPDICHLWKLKRSQLREDQHVLQYNGSGAATEDVCDKVILWGKRSTQMKPD